MLLCPEAAAATRGLDDLIACRQSDSATTWAGVVATAQEFDEATAWDNNDNERQNGYENRKINSKRYPL